MAENQLFGYILNCSNHENSKNTEDANFTLDKHTVPQLIEVYFIIVAQIAQVIQTNAV